MLPTNCSSYVKATLLAQRALESAELLSSVQIRSPVLGDGEFSPESIAKELAWAVGTLRIAPAVAMIGELLSDEVYRSSTGPINEDGLIEGGEERSRLRRLPVDKLKVIQQCLEWLDTFVMDCLDNSIAGNAHVVTTEDGSTFTISVGLTGVILNDGQQDYVIANLVDYVNERVKQNKAYLQGKNLTGISLEGIDLSGANLQGTNLAGANLKEADLYLANLTGANVEGADLTGVKKLDKVQGLSGLQFKNTKLSREGVETILKCNNNNHQRQEASRLCGVNLSGIDLSGLNLDYLNLSGANLSKANLSNTNLSHATLLHTNLEGADLRDTKLTLSSLLGVKINSDTQLNKESIRFLGCVFDWGYRWDFSKMDRYLNHLTNSETGSWLTVINSFSDQHNALKIALIGKIIGSLEGYDIESASDALMDIFMNNPLYYNDAKIALFIKDRLLKAKITAANTSQLEFSSEVRLRFYLDIVEVLGETKRRRWMLNNNGFFIQLMMQCTEKGTDPALISRAQALYRFYLDMPELKTTKQELEGMIVAADPGLVDTAEPADACFAFFNTDKNDINHILFLTRQQIKDMLAGELDATRNIYYMQGKPGEERFVKDKDEARNLEQIVQHISVFKAIFQPRLAANKFIRLFKVIDFQGLRQTIPDPVDPEKTKPGETYHSIFLKALEDASSTVKLTHDSDHENLSNIFGPLFEPDDGKGTKDIDKKMEITEGHRQQIMAAYDLKGATPQQQAQTLFSLATAFILLTSTKKFGEEGNSPEILRYYSLALMTEAYKLDPSVFGSTATLQQGNFNDYQRPLRGLDGINDSCTSVVTGVMVSHARQNGFIGLMYSLFPSVWLSLLP